MDKVRVRFAPSPTGFAHIGNMRNAVFDWLFAKHHNGKFILRIEDTDQARLVEGALDEIFESLRWLDTHWDEGPGVEGAYGPYFQSQRLDIYNRYARQLLEQGDAYFCYCSTDRLGALRKDQEAKKQQTGYDRLCLTLSSEDIEEKLEDGLCGVMRFKIPDDRETTTFKDAVRGDISFENRLLDDFVILKSDGYPTYHFASVVDDHLMNISHVIRSEEWISSTPKHVMLYEALGWQPPVWVHPPLILGPDRSKLSKRHGAVRFLDYKDRGFLPEAIMNFIALLGWSPGEEQEIFTVQELIQRFSLDGIVNHPVIFDIQKAEWMNGVYIRNAAVERVAELCRPFLEEATLVPQLPDEQQMAYIHDVIGLVKDRMKVLSEAVDLSRYFFEEEPQFEEKGMQKHLTKDYVPDLLRRLAERLQNLPELTVESIEEAVRALAEEMSLPLGQVVHPVRMAVTGRTVGSGLFETMAVLGKDRLVSRLNRTLGVIAEVVTD